MERHPTGFDWLLLAALVAAWGSSFVMSKIALQTLDPGWIAALRLVFGAVIVLAFSIFSGKPIATSPASLGRYAWLGFIGNAAPFLVITWGMQFTTSGVAGLLMGTIPLFIIVLAHFFLPNDRMTTRRAIGFMLGFIGVAVLIGPDALQDLAFHGDQLLGELCIVLGCLFYGLNGITAKLLPRGDAVPESAGVLIAAALMSLAWAALSSDIPITTASWQSLLATVGLGILPTGIATVVWFKAISRTSPTFVSMSNYLVPIYALAFGALTLGESIGYNALASLILVLSGIFVSRLPARQAKPQLSQ